MSIGDQRIERLELAAECDGLERSLESFIHSWIFMFSLMLSIEAKLSLKIKELKDLDA